MIYEYTNNRGVRISDKRIQDMLDYFGKEEEEMISFLGEERAKRKGQMYYVLEMLCTQDDYYRNRNR